MESDLHCYEVLEEEDGGSDETDGFAPDSAAYGRRRDSTSTSASSDSDLSPPSVPTTPLADASPDSGLAEQMLQAIPADFFETHRLDEILRTARTQHNSKRAYAVLRTPGFGYHERQHALHMLQWASQEANVSFEAVAVGMHALDRFVLARPDLVAYFPIAAIACFGLACKLLFDTVLVRLSDLADLLARYPNVGVPYPVSAGTIGNMEIIVLEALHYRVGFTTAATVTAQLVPYFPIDPAHQLFFLQQALWVIRVTSATNELLHFAPHVIALAAIRCAMNLSPYTADLAAYWAGAQAAFSAEPDLQSCELDECAATVECLLGLNVQLLAATTDALTLHPAFEF